MIKSIRIGGSLDAMLGRVSDAWHKAERGEDIPHQDCVTFADWSTLAKVLTPSRLAVLRHLHIQPEVSIRALSRALGRDYKRVHTDVTALIQAGLIDQQDDGLHADYDRIETVISLEPAA